MKAAPATPKRRVSGFCNPTLPRTAAYDPHQRCPGCDCRAKRCPCNPEGDIDVKNNQPEVTPAPAENMPADIPAAEPETPEVVVAHLAHDVALLDTALAGYHPDDWRDALRLLAELRDALHRARQVDSILVRWLYLHGEHGQHQTADGIAGEFYIGRGRSREVWAGPEAIRDYVDRKLQETDGEFTHESVIEWVLELVPVTPSVGLRVTPLKAAGLDVADYRSSEPGSLRVDLPRSG